MKDYYATLGVERAASRDEIKKAYRRLSMKHHPDKGGNEDKFKDISEAYAILSNDEKRRQYDNPNPFKDMNFNGFSGFRPRPKKPDINAPRDGQFIGVEVELSLSNFLFGGQFKVTLSYNESCRDCAGKGFDKGETCDHCNGEGYMQRVQRRPGLMSSSMHPCPKCGGIGVSATDRCQSCDGNGHHLVQNREFEFVLPPGTTIGSKHTLPGVGRAGVNGGKDGDVGIMIVGIKKPDLNKLTPNKLDKLKELLGELED